MEKNQEEEISSEKRNVEDFAKSSNIRYSLLSGT